MKTLAPGARVYLALADYALQRWTIEEPAFSGQVLGLDPARHSSRGGHAYVAVMANGGAAASVERLTLVAFHANAAPQAALAASVQAGRLPLLVSFDASASSGPDGSFVRCFWDFISDLLPDRITTSPETAYSFVQSGMVVVSAEALDDEGETASAAVEILVGKKDFDSSTAVRPSSSSNSIDAALINGNPALAYQDRDDFALKLLLTR